MLGKQGHWEPKKSCLRRRPSQASAVPFQDSRTLGGRASLNFVPWCLTLFTLVPSLHLNYDSLAFSNSSLTGQDRALLH